MGKNELKWVRMNWSVLECVAMCWNELECVAIVGMSWNGLE